MYEYKLNRTEEKEQPWRTPRHIFILLLSSLLIRTIAI